MGKAVIRTFTGKMIDLENPKVEQIDIRDIAHHLTLINRFVGATGTPYSVAEHCLIGSEIILGGFALEFLLHDASEAYLGDVSWPLKSIIGGRYEELESLFMDVIAERFDVEIPRSYLVPAPPWCEVERVDHLMKACELDVLMGARMPLAMRKRLAPESDAVMRALETRGGTHIESRFLARYEELQLRRGVRGSRAK